MKNGTVLLKKEAYTRKKGLDAYVEYYVVGETNKALLVTRYPSRGLEKAVKVPKKGTLKEFGFFRSWEEVKEFIAKPKQVQAPLMDIEKQIAKVTDPDKLKRIEAILNEGTQPRQRRARIATQPKLVLPKPIPEQPSESLVEDLPVAARMRRPITILRKRNSNGEFVKKEESNISH
jgi:hypothetical protein